MAGFSDPRPSASSVDGPRAQIAALSERADLVRCVYQPIVELATARVVGYEALARFDDLPERPAAEWFGLAQEYGQSPPLEAAALRAALSSPELPADTFLGINLSPTALASPEVWDCLPSDMSSIVVEVTEHELVLDDGRLGRTLSDVRARGGRVAVDDAGAGYAGLEWLTRLEPDIIKLDGRLTGRVRAESAKAALVEVLVRFARRTGATVCAEGIERLDDLAILGDLDVALGQGFVLARPGSPWPTVSPAAKRVCRAGHDAAMQVAPRQNELVENGDHDLERIGAWLSDVDSIDDLRGAFRLVARDLGAVEVCFSRWHEEEGYVETVSDNAWMHTGERFSVDDYPLTRHVLETQEAVQVLASDADADPAEVALLRAEGFRALLMVPVVSHGRTLGLLEVCDRVERPWTRGQIVRARIICYQLGAVLEGLSHR
jgi:EAL domain-containing protein (putative c-di-GMP-specific phosphodiesterase class I)